MIEAIKRLQELAQSCSWGDGQIHYAPDYPVENAAVLPFSIAHFGDGSATAADASFVKFMPNIFVDFFFARAQLSTAYRQMDSVIEQYPKLLAGDPTLADTVVTIRFPITWTEPTRQTYNTLDTLMVRFTVPIKTLPTPTT